MVTAFEWSRIFKGDEYTWFFLFEVMFRTGIMFILMVLFFRLSGKTEIRQLNIYDVIIIVGLGSAAGDPMLYDDVPLLNGIFVFITVLGLYRLVSWMSGKHKTIDRLLEGDIRCVLDESNRIDFKVLKKEGVQVTDLHNALRIEKVSQLGQVERIYIETSGEFSIFFRKDEDVISGLPLYPEELKNAKKHIDVAGDYCCTHCGLMQSFPEPRAQANCPYCEKKDWVASTSRRRVT